MFVRPHDKAKIAKFGTGIVHHKLYLLYIAYIPRTAEKAVARHRTKKTNNVMAMAHETRNKTATV